MHSPGRRHERTPSGVLSIRRFRSTIDHRVVKASTVVWHTGRVVLECRIEYPAGGVWTSEQALHSDICAFPVTGAHARNSANDPGSFEHAADLSTQDLDAPRLLQRARPSIVPARNCQPAGQARHSDSVVFPVTGCLAPTPRRCP